MMGSGGLRGKPGVACACCRTQGTGHAILVAGAEHGDAGSACGLPGGAIAHGFAGAHGAGLQDGAFKQGHGLHGIGKLRGRVAAIDGDAGADEIMGVILAQKDAAGIGEAGGDAGEKAADFPEGVALF